jgi:hypothetical protein
VNTQTAHKIFPARYASICQDCGGDVNVGDSIWYDGHPHHADTLTCQYWEIKQAEEKEARAARPVVLDLSAVEDVTPTVPAAPAIMDGTYTIVRPNGDWRTLRVRTQSATASFAPGKQVIRFLAGSDNESEKSYVGFAFITDAGIKMWSKYASNQDLRLDAETLVFDPESAGERYAMESQHCYRCGHLLTVPASLHRGLGPECAKRVAA